MIIIIIIIIIIIWSLKCLSLTLVKDTVHIIHVTGSDRKQAEKTNGENESISNFRQQKVEMKENWNKSQ